ncbi:3-hydroxyacyl-CoA dehydrogenase family protein [Naasia aerilata]|uniref:3-hydroxyacyl-CoA dehydrogenase n=1 Tax=Naasia aerilata TaxID=1162966 RepID=A0ABN6XI57_9MICO|nr:3-hydroxyacyl-CoA dehydrogenase family protein [Naasia aerilata]BDZ44546.1 3-hydroxyacyl-CoA dehydrogenase [Naasia aerilata]
MTDRVAVVGSGYMGGGIAQVLVLAGYEVAIADVTLEAAQQSRERLLAESRAFVADGLFPPDATENLEEHLVAATLEDAVATASFIEEAVPERLDLKRDTLARISSAARPDAVIGSNTSSISIASMAEAVDRPERFLGVHFSNPSPFIPGVEVIPHDGTSDDAVAVARALVAAVGKQSALVQDKTGFVLNRLQFALFNEAARVVEEGVASARDVDAIIRTTLGFRLPFFGPFAIADMAGLDTYALVFGSLHAAYPDRFPMPQQLAELVEQGHFGTKTGKGFLELDPARVAEVVAYRNRAYVAMSKLLAELGPAPLD